MRTRISVDEYEQMTFDADLRLELLRGEIVPMSPIGDRHAWCVDQLTEFFVFQAQRLAKVRIQNPIVLDDSEPQPDISLAKFRDHGYRHGKPRAADVLLVIQVADRTLDKDHDVKGPMYAEAGIAEYWIVNLIDERVEVYTVPQGGVYTQRSDYHTGDSIRISCLSGSSLAVATIL